MTMPRFIAGLDQELQVKFDERGVKTFTDAFNVAYQAERARQAARLVMPVPPTNVSKDNGSMQTVKILYVKMTLNSEKQSRLSLLLLKT